MDRAVTDSLPQPAGPPAWPIVVWVLAQCALAAALTRGGFAVSPSAGAGQALATLAAAQAAVAATLFPWLVRSWRGAALAGGVAAGMLALTGAATGATLAAVTPTSVYVLLLLGALLAWEGVVARDERRELLAAAVAIGLVVLAAGALYLRAEFSPRPPPAWTWHANPVTAAALSASPRPAGAAAGPMASHLPPLASAAILVAGIAAGVIVRVARRPR